MTMDGQLEVTEITPDPDDPYALTIRFNAHADHVSDNAIYEMFQNRSDIAILDNACRTALGHLDDPTDVQAVDDMRKAATILRDALRTAQETAEQE